jgi:triacylglycerol lipase
VLSSPSPARRRLLPVVIAVVLAGLLAVAAVVVLRGGDDPPPPAAVVPDRPGPVLLVPGYGGSTAALESLAARLRAAGRDATVVRLPGGGTGDLAGQAAVLDTAARAALSGGAPSVDVVGYSAGGVVARVWAADGGAAVARRIVTLGSPHHGTQVAALGASLFPGQCPTACRQLVPGSELLRGLEETPAGPLWVSLWTTADQVVTPPDSARLDGALNVPVQTVCGDTPVSHAQLPTAPAVQSLVLAALAPVAPTALSPTDCT